MLATDKQINYLCKLANKIELIKNINKEKKAILVPLPNYIDWQEERHLGVRVEMMPYGKKFVLSREFSKFRFVDGFSVFLEEESEYYTLTLYYQNTELVSITFDDGLKDPGKKYMVYVNQPYYENGKSTFVVRQKETDKQYIFLETGSAKVAFNMVNRIVSGMRYPKAKMIW